LRQWFSVSSSDDQQRLIRGSGLTVDRALGRSVSTNSEGKQTVSYSETEQVVSRFTINDVLLTSDHPFRSFLRISRGAGYAQYGGLPVIIESSYHISQEEYRRRKSLPWPSGPGTFLPLQAATENPDEGPKPAPSGPQWTEEVIGGDPTPLSEIDAQAIDGLFQQFQQSMPTEKPRKRRTKK
jgi:hypothetical protein